MSEENATDRLLQPLVSHDGNASGEPQDVSQMARSKNRKLVEALENGETVSIRSSQWNEFVRLSELLYPGSKVWRCVFSSGKVAIQDVTNKA